MTFRKVWYDIGSNELNQMVTVDPSYFIPFW